MRWTAQVCRIEFCLITGGFWCESKKIFYKLSKYGIIRKESKEQLGSGLLQAHLLRCESIVKKDVSVPFAPLCP